MSDFLVSFSNKYSGNNLLELLKMPYGKCVPKGRCFDFSWGSMAILEERLADNNNILEREGVVFAWVGDLVTDVSEEFVDALIIRIGQIKNCRANRTFSLESDEVFRKLNGAFAIVLAYNEGFSVITDPLSFTQVYVGNDLDNSPLCVGTHPDSISVLCGSGSRIDAVSVGEFLSQGTPPFPYTMYENVKELDPGSVHIFEAKEQKRQVRGVLYWYPPEEIRGQYDEGRLGKELKERLVAAIRDKCRDRKVGVALSGGLDSRVVLALVPEDVDCVGLTYCDMLNREAKTAKNVADCYDRSWYPIFRDKEHLANSIIPATSLVGCEFEWVAAHGLGLSQDIEANDIDALLTGQWFNSILKAYNAHDIVRAKRLGGLLPPVYKKIPYDYVNTKTDFCRENLTVVINEQMLTRRSAIYEKHAHVRRTSISEWLCVYPISQMPDAATWSVERRILPVAQVATDRRILEFGFRCPLELKLGERIINLVSMKVLGVGVHIRNANDGVKPGSGHWSRLFQRAIRKSQDRTTKILEKLGREPKIQHSWHDYQKYWRESEKLDQLRQQYGANLNQFDGILFKDSGPELLENKDLDWHYGFRLLQLAVWLGIIEEYRKKLWQVKS